MAGVGRPQEVVIPSEAPQPRPVVIPSGARSAEARNRHRPERGAPRRHRTADADYADCAVALRANAEKAKGVSRGQSTVSRGQSTRKRSTASAAKGFQLL